MELAHGPRNVLRQAIGKLAEHGLQLKTGVEVEFFLLDGATSAETGSTVGDTLDVQSKVCVSERKDLRAQATAIRCASRTAVALVCISLPDLLHPLARSHATTHTRSCVDTIWSRS